MARPRGSRNALNLDQAIQSIAAQIRSRVGELKQEIQLKQDELDRLSATYQQITGGKVGGGAGGRGGRGVGRPAGAGRGGKRIRRQGVDVKWISNALSKQPMTLRQLQSVAEREGRSALSVMNVLRANQKQFKASEGEKDPGVRGRAAQVWSTK